VTAVLAFLFPALGATAVGFRAARVWSVWILLSVAVLDSGVAGWLTLVGPERVQLLDGYLVVDPTARLFLLLINAVFLAIAAYVWNRVRTAPELKLGLERSVGLSLAFMAAANLVVLSNHLLAMWAFLELTTLLAAPLIIRAGASSSVVASWRYLRVSSVGLGLTLLGFVFIARSLESGGVEPTFFIDRLVPLVSGPSDRWREMGLALIFLGYGTKLGLAPMYTWLPETYDEAPPPVTALLAGVQFNCALVAVFRVIEVFRGGDQAFVSRQLVAVGLMSMAVSTFSIIVTRNYQRLIAYASINHAGVIAIALGIGKRATYGLLLYVFSNAFIKVILFLTAGKINSHYRTKDMRQVSGLIKDLPYSGLLLMVGTFALLGFPPFGSFLGELIILSGLIGAGYPMVFVVFCVLLTVTFMATGRSVFPMIWNAAQTPVHWPRQSLPAMVPKLLFVAALVSMGLYLPPGLNTLFRQVAASLGGE
jgi:hydrogenase-4 component F